MLNYFYPITDLFVIGTLNAQMKTYRALAGPNGESILRKIYPTDDVIHPNNALMPALCPETADAVSDFLRTSKIATIDSTHYKPTDGFKISSENVLNLGHTKYFGDQKGNWQTPKPSNVNFNLHAPHEVAPFTAKPPKDLPEKPKPTEKQIADFNKKVEAYNNAVIEYKQKVKDWRENRLTYYTETLADIGSGNIDTILDQIGDYIRTKTFLGLVYGIGHVVVHGIRNDDLTSVNRNDRTQHFFVIMMYHDDMYLVDAMVGFKVNLEVIPDSDIDHPIVVEGDNKPAINNRGPLITKDIKIIRSYIRNENFKNLRYTLTYDAVPPSHLKKNKIINETTYGVPDFSTNYF